MVPLPIVWQRLVAETGATCPRCDKTYSQLTGAVTTLRGVLAPLDIEPVLTIKGLDEAAFRSNPNESNRIWIGNKPLEDWLGARSGSSQCCSVCGDSPCRTTELSGRIYEEIPGALIIKAALLAASQLVGEAEPEECCN